MVSYQVFIERLADWFMQLFLDPGYINDAGTDISRNRVITKTRKVIIGFKKPLLELISVLKEKHANWSESILHNSQQAIKIVSEFMLPPLRSQALMAQWLY